MSDNFYLKGIAASNEGGQVFLRAVEKDGIYTPVHQIQGYDPLGDKLVVGTAKDRFFDNFFEFTPNGTEKWEFFLQDPNEFISADGPLGGLAAGSSPYIIFDSSIDTEGVLAYLSRSMFRAPLDLRYQLTATARIANASFRIGFVEVDPVTGQIITHPGAPSVLNARNAVFLESSGTVATTNQLLVRAAGSAVDIFPLAYGTGFTTVATGTGPNWIAPTTYGLSFERDRISSRAWGQNVNTNTGGQFAYDRVMPDPTKAYRLAIMADTGTVPPASPVTWRLHLVNVLDGTRFDVAPRAAGRSDGAQSFPTVVNGGTLSTVTTVSTVTAVTTAGTPPVHHAETTTNLAANATFTGTTRDGGSTPVFNSFNVQGISPTPGTIEIQMGTATPATFVCRRQAVIANEPFELKVPVTARYYRVVFINGATAMTGSAFMINSAFQRAN